MSNAALNWAWGLRGLSLAEHCVLARIADRANDDGKAWPSIRGLADDTGADPSTVVRVVSQLEAKGLIEIERKAGRNSTYKCLCDATSCTTQPVAPCERSVGAVQTPVYAPRALGVRTTRTKPTVTPTLTHNEPKGPRAPPALPEFLDAKTWADYCDMRKRIRKPMTPRAMELAFAKLDGLRSRGEDAKAVLEQSILNSWQGLFAVKQDSHNGNGNGQKLTRQEQQGRYWDQRAKDIAAEIKSNEPPVDLSEDIPF